MMEPSQIRVGGLTRDVYIDIDGYVQMHRYMYMYIYVYIYIYYTDMSG